MKRMFLACLVVVLFACNQGTKEETTAASNDSTTVKSAPSISYSYTAGYSNSFAIGDPQNSETVLKAWKAWDNGDLSASKDLFADSVTLHFRNGAILAGSRDSVVAAAQKIRDMYAKVQSSVAVFIPLKATDKNENWVTIWGKEVNTDKKGKMDSTELQETWRLNSNGKIDLLYQYAAAAAPPKK
ncbi:MAG TPA: hypothetical protein VFS36_08495 [Chitinophagaceae bacterium]|jgi:hypothetical protein|nr:hypothetical protein [Chitinophagaceae bacterium]